MVPGMLAEAIGTFFLMWAIMGVAVNPRATKEWAALAIGAALGLGVMVIAPLTGAGFNPARASARRWCPASSTAVANSSVFVLAPVIGAILAGLAYFNLVIAPGKKGVGGVEPVG